jgi:hypothetical protein
MDGEREGGGARLAERQDEALDVAHAPTLLRKVNSAYVTDEGQDVPEHALHRYECSCGWRGSCWYAGHDRALGHFTAHLTGGEPR